MNVALVVTDLTTDEARRRPDGEMVLSVTTTQASPEYARNLTDRIKVGLDFTWVMVIEAYQVRAHAALGYSSWDDYCTREFGTSRIRIPREDRQEAVGSLREMGFSIRAIASATGADRKTVRRDLQAGGPISPTSSAEVAPSVGVGNSHTSPATPEAPVAKSSPSASASTPAAKAAPEPPPGLVSEWLDWPFVLAVLAAWAVIELALFARRWRAESRAIDADLAAMDEQSQRSAQTGRWVA